MSDTITTKFIVGDYKKDVTLEFDGSKIWFTFGYNKKLIEEIKQMEGARWHGFDEPKPIKKWSIKNSARNRFQIAFLEGKNPYAMYDRDLLPVKTSRPLYQHQFLMVQHGITYHNVILAAEMGTGKTLAAIEIMEYVKRTIGLDNKEAWYVGPKSGVFAVGRELVKWSSLVKPVMMTYEKLTNVTMGFKTATDVPPRLLILDESSKVKTPTAQRSMAAYQLSELMRAIHKDHCYIILMSGTPAPKSPIDWWHQCEVACPGFLKEGTIHKFKARLCVIEERQSITGGVYPHIVTWLDNYNKCRVCGQLKEANVHDEWFVDERIVEAKKLLAETTNPEDKKKLEESISIFEKHNKQHAFVTSKNEVEYLYERMKGLVLVQFKKDCLDLPEKQYQLIELTPPPDMVRAMKLIKSTATRTIEALTLMRELADGFQYVDRKTGEESCSVCKGIGTIEGPVPKSDVSLFEPTAGIVKEDFGYGKIICDNCGGTGKVPTYERHADTLEKSSPKDEAFIDLLDEHEECGRFIVWGGFTGTIDKLVQICHKYGWDTLCVDGRGFIGKSAQGETLPSEELLDAMDLSNPKYTEYLEKYPKLCFVGHPQAGGMALTLTASPTELFYSNCFNGEARMQAEDRFHRAGMDKNRGATIIDLILLPTDRLVLDNLRKKKKLQSITMGEIEKAIESVGNTDEPRIKS